MNGWVARTKFFPMDFVAVLQSRALCDWSSHDLGGRTDDTRQEECETRVITIPNTIGFTVSTRSTSTVALEMQANNNDEDFHEDHLHRHHAIVSGDSDDDASGTSDPVAAQIRAEEALLRRDPNNPRHADDLLYDHKLDDEDEDYVYTNMRGGARKPGLEEADLLQEPTQRRSDAVLSCPSCFNIVCMDCQRHQTYHNQFRAMFVMGITVNWNERLVYDQAREFLVPKPHHPAHHVPPETTSSTSWDEEESHPKLQFVKGEYFPVLCASCETQVAALDMPDGVYHFYGCLESSN
eukprot:Nitzschia sp. Nitz4//scaffold8_size234185//39090//39971//NITZ4_001236-RA/size234185-processed-gene-0.145-mRNA-1//-1//CDS//3329559743//555//frame0